MYALPEAVDVHMSVYNILGQEIVRLLPYYASSTHEYLFKWDGRNRSGSTVTSGVYILRPALNNTFVNHIRKVVITK